MKTKVQMRGYSPYNEWKKGDIGYIDGYVYNGRQPLAAIVINDTVALAAIGSFKVIGIFVP